ncbi:MAG: hypothetical protein FWD65_03055 [Coriobacteriia bacterium]|nr:hypothetical protein [Coriobacteriia bacterium]
MKKWKKMIGVLVVLLALAAVVAGRVYYENYQRVHGATPALPIETPTSIDDPAFAKAALRHDLKPLQDIFVNIEGMERCYWQKATYNPKGCPSYEIYRGFIVLKSADFKKLKATYRWEKTNGDLLSELALKTTGYHNFKWTYNQDFEGINNNSMPSEFSGPLRLDLKNGIIYFYLMNRLPQTESTSSTPQTHLLCQ